MYVSPQCLHTIHGIVYVHVLLQQRPHVDFHFRAKICKSGNYKHNFGRVLQFSQTYYIPQLLNRILKRIIPVDASERKFVFDFGVIFEQGRIHCGPIADFGGIIPPARDFLFYAIIWYNLVIFYWNQG